MNNETTESALEARIASALDAAFPFAPSRAVEVAIAAAVRVRARSVRARRRARFSLSFVAPLAVCLTILLSIAPWQGVHHAADEPQLPPFASFIELFIPDDVGIAGTFGDGGSFGFDDDLEFFSHCLVAVQEYPWFEM